jgi:uncharacterized protein YdhG (YjbR/CyaY superfamily)
MAERKPVRKSSAFTDEERAAMRARSREAKAGAGADGASEVREAIAAMQESDRIMAERVHAVVTAAVPALSPRTWYGMPAYALDGKVVCFFQTAARFKTRYATLGFSDKANLDDGAMWPNAYALAELTPEVEERIAALVRQAVS